MINIKSLANQSFKHYQIEPKHFRLWISKGNERESIVLIDEAGDNFEYELIYYFSNQDDMKLSYFFHEMGHVISLEKYRIENGMEEAKKILDQYDEEVERIRHLTGDELEKNYKKLFLEEQADIIADELMQFFRKRGLLE